MSAKNTVSVVIPTFKRAEFLRRAIDSVKKQSYDSIELVVVDDNVSEDESRLVMDLCDKNCGVTYVKNFRSKGACGARNSGIISSSGKYIAFLDDDDIWHPDKIKKQVEFFSKKDCDANYSGVFIKSNTMGDRTFTGDGCELFAKDVFSGNFPLSSSLLIVKRDCINKSGMFDESLPSFQDYDLVVRILGVGKIFNIPEALAEFNEHSGERISVNVEKRVAALELLVKKWGYEIQKYCKVDDFKRKFMTEALMANARSNFGVNYRRSVYYSFGAFKSNPFCLKSISWVILSIVGARLGKKISSIYRSVF